jgi:CRP-like cAMP-binding protein
MPESLRYTFNYLLAALPDMTRRDVFPLLSPVSLSAKQILYDLDDQIDFVYFPLTATISLINIMKNGATVEVATVGREGVVGLSVILEVNKAFARTIVQVPGEALEISVQAFRTIVEKVPQLHGLLLRYVQVLFQETFLSSGCNRFHSVEQRVGRWLLAQQDRTDRNVYPFTHEFLSEMLGVQRSTVTEVTGQLQKAGLIEYSQGQMRILNRKELQQVSCECYLATKETLDAYIEGLQEVKA